MFSHYIICSCVIRISYKFRSSLFRNACNYSNREKRSGIVALNMTIDPVRISRLTYPKTAAKTRQRVPNRHVRSLHGLAHMLLYRCIKVSTGRASMALVR